MQKIPSPQDLGFPPKFDAWRPSQIEALRLLTSSTKRVKVVSMPTGGGKSAVYVAYTLITGRPTVIVTESRGLQDQLMADFSGIGMVDLRGRDNYPCGLRTDYSCQDGYAARCGYKGSVMCPASQAGMRAAASSLVVTNFAKWTTAKRFGAGLEHQTQVVFDEGHNAPEAIARAMQVVLSHREIEEVLGIDFPKPTSEMVDWKVWAIRARNEAEGEMLAARANLGPRATPTVVRHYLHMRNLTKRLTTIATAQPHNWIQDEWKNSKFQTAGYQFDPLKPGMYCESALFMKTPDVAIFSATIRPKTLYQLHQSKESFSYWEFESDFDPADAPIYHVPTMRVDRHHPDLGMLWVRLDQFAARRQDRKGIVHTISYAKRDEILAASRFAGKMLVNPRGEPTTEFVELFKEADPGTILVSPSVGAGYDFPGAFCEWQMVCKIPFTDSRSKIIKARMEADKEYGPYAAMNRLQQICGRGARYKGDRCETLIPDDNFVDWFKPRYEHLATREFWRRFKSLKMLPSPPPPLEG